PRQPEPPAGRHQPTLLQVDDAVRVNIEEAGLGAGDHPINDGERLALFIGRGAVALEADDPRAPLIVAAALEAADGARHIEGAPELLPAEDHHIRATRA